jgi:FdhD protein
MRRNILAVPVRRVVGTASESLQDLVAVEEPLEIRIGDKPVSITMRTPGNDLELAAGFLFGEGILCGAGDIERIEAKGENVVRIVLQAGADATDTDRLERNFYMSSSCGICGKASIEAVHTTGCAVLPRDGLAVAAEIVHGLPGGLRQSQAVFDRTGGLHGAALFDVDGKLCSVREDVGRHNAVDKVIGSEVLAGRTPLFDKMLLVSGRASFELVQKAVMAGIPLLAAVGAPSSLAVDLARRFQMTLLGFVRDDRFNIYSGEWRVR